MTFIEEIQRFLRNPEPQQSHFRWIRVWEIYSWGSILAILSGILISIIIARFGVAPENAVEQVLEDASPWAFAFLAVIAAPVLEELLFRLPITRYKRDLWLWLGLMPLLVWVVFGFTPLIVSIMLVLMLIGGVMLFLIKKERFQFLVHKSFPLLVYLTSVIFGLIHLGNYSGLPWLSGGIVIFVLPQLIIGFLLAFARVRLGFLSTILLHALHNGSITLPILIMYPALSKLESGVELLPSEEIRVGISSVVYILYLIVIISGVIWSLVAHWKYTSKS